MDDIEIIILRIFYNNYNNFIICHSNKNNEFKITIDHYDENDERNNKNDVIAIQNFQNGYELIWHRWFGHFYQEDFKNHINIHKVK